ncbi:MAG TPA: hypothetical protein V6C63_08605, partial [Allocoleopsis sp.]
IQALSSINTLQSAQSGRNSDAALASDRNPANSEVAADVIGESGVMKGVRYIQQVLSEVKQRLQNQRRATPAATSQDAPENACSGQSASGQSASAAPSGKSAHWQRLQQYLASGDPILVAEAQAMLSVPLGTPKTQIREPQAIANDAKRDCVERDCAELLAQISIHRQRLSWSTERLQAALQQLFGKADQARLTDEELMTWLHWLQRQL